MGALVCKGTDTRPEFVTFGGRPTLEEFIDCFGAPTELCRTDETFDEGLTVGGRPGASTALTTGPVGDDNSDD